MGSSRTSGNKSGGQRNNLNRGKGKKRTEQSSSHRGSRVEPSHEVEKSRAKRRKASPKAG